MRVLTRNRNSRLRRQQRRQNVRVRRGKASRDMDLFIMPDYLFKLHFRFNKETVNRIAETLSASLKPLRGSTGYPISIRNQVAIALLQLSGGCFQRIAGLACSGITQSTARKTTLKVINALIRMKNEWIKFPTPEEMNATAWRMFEYRGLRDCFAGVDGVQIRFQKAPRNIPHGHDVQSYWCHKQFYSLNVMIVANDRYIYDVDCGWFGSAHDAWIWNRSSAKMHIENDPSRYIILGDSAYPLSTKLMKPYDANSRHQLAFNARLCAIRTRMTEHIYGQLKQRFPILREMRHHFRTSQKIIIVCCILHNMAEFLLDEVPDEVNEMDPHKRPLPGVDVGRVPEEGTPGRLPYFDPGPTTVSPRESLRLAQGKWRRDVYLREFVAANRT